MLRELLHVTSRFLLIGLVSLLVALPLNAQKPATTDKSDDVAIEQESLRKYMDLSILPVSQRRTVFKTLSPQHKSKLWKISMALYLTKRPELGKAQQEFILDAMALATPELFDIPQDDATKKVKAEESLQLLSARAFEIFSKTEATEILATLGGGEKELVLLKKYADVSRLPLPQRRSLFRSSTSEEKCYLWRTHITLYLANHPDLKKAQGEFILQTLELTKIDLFEVANSDPNWKVKVEKPLQLLFEHALEVFSKKEARELFAQLGNNTSSPNLAHSKPAQIPDCECSYIVDTCSTKCFGNGCTQAESGCGPFWLLACREFVSEC